MMTLWQSGKTESNECMRQVVLLAVDTNNLTLAKLQTLHLQHRQLLQFLIN